MIVGHIGLALAARSWRRDAPLVLLVGASLAPDVLDAGYALAGICNPFGVYSHSLPAIGVVAAVAAAIAFVATRSVPAAAAMGLVALSHVPADYLTGAKLAWMHGPIIGLSLYRWPFVDFLLELPLIVAGWWLVRRAAAASGWMTARRALAALLVVQAAYDLSMPYRQRRRADEPVSACLEAYRRSGP